MELEKEIKQKAFANQYQKAVVNILYTGNWVNLLHTHLLKEYTISTQQFNVLRILRGRSPEPASVKLLNERMLDKMSNVSRLIDKLVAKKLVTRSFSKHDRRQVDIFITDEGERVLAELDDKMVNFLEDNFHTIDESEVIELNRILDKLRG